MSERVYAGNTPGDGWTLVTSVEADGAKWAVFWKPSGNEGWWAVKVCAQKPVPFKANYWLGWSGTRLAASGDLGKMAEHRPALAPAVRQALEEASSLI